MEQPVKTEADNHEESAKNPAQMTDYSELDDAAKLALEAASEKKAIDFVVLDLRELTSFTEFFLIVSGTNQRQVQAISNEISSKLRNELKTKPQRVEGYQGAEWILLDYGDFIFHVFNGKSREFYDLERLWRDAKKVNIPKDL